MPEDISYHNKDIVLKILSQTYKNKSLKVYGLDLPPIKEILPTNLPALKLDEKRADNVFLLEDDTILILEYESVALEEDLLKYAHYAFRVYETYYKEKKPHKVIIAVIYTGDVKNTPGFLDMGSIHLSIKQVFLSKFNGQEIFNELENKVQNNTIDDEDIMKFIILPLTRKEDKQKLVENTVNLAMKISDENKKDFVIAGVIAVAHKFLDEKYLEKVKGWLKMTSLGRMFEEEKLDAVNKAVQKITAEKEKALQEKDELIKKITKEKDEAIQKATKEAEKEATKKIVQNMLEQGLDIIVIMAATGLTKAQIEEYKVH